MAFVKGEEVDVVDVSYLVKSFLMEDRPKAIMVSNFSAESEKYSYRTLGEW